MSTIFSKIINKEIPSYTIAENENFISFLDINPLTVGHCLVCLLYTSPSPRDDR